MLLAVRDLAVRYGGAVALDGVSIDVAEGEVVGLIGANGAGKTTLLRSISRTVQSTGKVEFDGLDVSTKRGYEMPRLGVAHVPEGRRLFARLPVEDNLVIGAYATTAPTAEDFERVYALFPWIRDRRRQLAGTLSGGEQQMVAIARGLMSHPRLLMLDEPSLGISPALVEQIYETIAQLRQEGQTILLAEQNVLECLEVSDRTYVLQTGKVVTSGMSAQLLDSDDIRKAFLGI